MNNDLALITKKLNHTLEELEYYKNKLEKLQLEKTSPSVAINLIKKTSVHDNKVFDEVFYLNEYPDVKEVGLDPYQHYLSYGEKMGRKINANDNVCIVGGDEF